MYSRRRFLTSAATAAAGLTLAACRDDARAVTAGAATATASAASPGALNMRNIPATGEKIPVIGMGTSGSFEVGMSASESDPLREVL
ncbi:MAG: aldo/keto reductase, partial [Burkholderiales bacterium]